MRYVITNEAVTTQLGTKVAHNGTVSDQRRALAEAETIDKQKMAAATARAEKAGHAKPLTAEQVRTGSWSREAMPVRVRVAVENAERALQTNPTAAAGFLRSAAEGARAKLQANNWRDSDGIIAREIEMCETLAVEYEERGRFLSEVRPATKPDTPATPSWIETERKRIESDWQMSAEAKKRRLARLTETEERHVEEIHAEEERKAVFDRSEYTSALIDAQLSVTLAEMAHDLDESFVIGARARLANLQATGDDTTYRAETAVAESKAKEFRELKKAEREAQDKAAREAAGEPAPTNTLYNQQ